MVHPPMPPACLRGPSKRQHEAQRTRIIGVQDQDRLCGSAAVDPDGLAVELVHHGSERANARGRSRSGMPD